MKSVIKLFSLMAIMSTIVMSCQKELTIEEGGGPDIPSTNDGVYLDKVYLLANLGAGLDTLVTVTVHYDNLKRVILWADSTSSAVDDPYITSYKYFYNGSDTVPYKFVGLWDDLLTADDFDSTTAFFTYNTAGKKIKDSIVFHEYSGGSASNSLEITNYSYGTNKMYGETKSETITPFPFLIVRRDTASLNAVGDILQNKSYLLEGSAFELAETMDVTYDTKSSPFQYLTSYAAHKSFPYQMLELFDHVSKANILTENSSTILPNPETFTRSSTYQYNNFQLPVKVTSTVNQGTPDQENYQVIYTYKKL